MHFLTDIHTRHNMYCRWDVKCLSCCEQMSQLNLRLKLQMTSAAVMSSRVVMGRVFLCLSAVIGQNITVLMAPTSSTAVSHSIYSLLSIKSVAFQNVKLKVKLNVCTLSLSCLCKWGRAWKSWNWQLIGVYHSEFYCWHALQPDDIPVPDCPT